MGSLCVREIERERERGERERGEREREKLPSQNLQQNSTQIEPKINFSKFHRNIALPIKKIQTECNNYAASFLCGKPQPLAFCYFTVFFLLQKLPFLELNVKTRTSGHCLGTFTGLKFSIFL
jgi:hypothetical protein